MRPAPAELSAEAGGALERLVAGFARSGYPIARMQQPFTTILLIRHGHTAGNARGPDVRMSGWTDLPLSPEGQFQALALARHLATSGRPSVVYASPLQRAVHTGRAIAGACAAPLVLEAGLREINCGAADGLTLAEVKARYPRAWAANLAQDDADFRWPGGESYRELRARAWCALHAIAVRHPGARIAVVTHAGVITQVLGRIAGESAARWEAMRPRNASVTELLWADPPRLVRFDAVPPERAA